MNLQLLDTIYFVLPAPLRTRMQQAGFNVLSDFRMVQGYRLNTYWKNEICRKTLSDIITNNPQLLHGVLPINYEGIKKTCLKDLKKYYSNISSYFQRLGAPAFTLDEAEAKFDDAIFMTPEFDAWLKDWLKTNNPDAEFKKSILRAYSESVCLRLFLDSANDTLESFSRRFWDKMGPYYKVCPDFQTVQSYFEIPDDLVAKYDIQPATVRRTAELPEELAQWAGELQDNRQLEIGNPVCRKRSADLCGKIVDTLIDCHCYETAVDYALQRLRLSTETDAEAAGEQYLLAEASAHGFTDEVKKGVEQYLAVGDLAQRHPDLMAKVEKQAKETEAFRHGFFRVWRAEEERVKGVGYKKITKSFWGTLHLLTKNNCINLLEFLHNGVDLIEWKTKAEKAEAMVALGIAQREVGLTATGVQSLRFAKPYSQKESDREAIRYNVVLGLATDGLFKEAVSEYEDAAKKSTKRQLSRMRTALAEVCAKQVFAKAHENPELLPVLGGAFVTDALGTTLPDDLQELTVAKATELVKRAEEIALREAAEAAEAEESEAAAEVKESKETEVKPEPSTPVVPSALDPLGLPYPRRYIGVIGRWCGHINFSPKYVLVGGRWVSLSRAEQETLFPRKGWISLRFSNIGMANSLRNGRLVVLDLGQNEAIPTDDPDFTLCLEPQIGRQLHYLSDLGALVVTPEDQNEELDFTRDTYVKINDEEQDNSVFDGETVVVHECDDYFGPFILRRNASNRLYVPKITPVEAMHVVSKHPVGPESFLDILSESSVGTLRCQLALTSNEKAFTEEGVDCLKDGALLRATSVDIPQLPAFNAIEPALAAATILSDKTNRMRLKLLFENFNVCNGCIEEAHELGLKTLVNRLKKEAKQKEKPVTQAVADAVEHTPELEALGKRLRNEREALKAEHEAALKEERTRFEKEKAELEKTLSSLKAEVASTEAEGAARKAFWQSEMVNVLDKAKADYARFKASPYLDIRDLGQTPAKSAETAPAPAKDKKPNYVAQVSSLWDLPAAKGHTSAIRERLIKGIQDRRAYTHDEAVNLLISVALNFLTIFSGEPGSGKTSVCRILAETLGLTNLGRHLQENEAWAGSTDYDRFLTVPVERGWTSKRDFLGYYNPLTQSFNTNDRRRYDALRRLNAESQTTHDCFPFLFLLDEANLSPMEYYWADFMGICGGAEGSIRSIMLGDNQLCTIPDHMRFLATINIDDTTEPLSPRLLDRAWIVRLPAPQFSPARTVPTLNPVYWKDFALAFGDVAVAVAVKNAPELPEMQPFLDAMRGLGLNVSIRSRQAMAKFVAVGTPLFEGKHQTAIDYAVAQKLLPQIHGSGTAFREKLVALRSVCEGCQVSAGILDEIIVRGEQNLNFYQYF